jgi:predicted Fe-Mo cluster-binding NifX family protein/NAD-dependent dihydropyrimidine dehydrogenase PreA subunit
MKVAVTCTGPTLDDQVEVRFGRCPYFLLVDTESMEFEVVENPNTALGGGAGIQSAQMMAEKGVSHVLTGNCGPNAFSVFGQAGVDVIVGVSGRARDAVERFKAGEFSSASAANVQSHFGMAAGAPQEPITNTGSADPPTGMSGMGMGRGGGGGMGGGRGRGGGRGMGGGGGMGGAMFGGGTFGAPPTVTPDDLQDLKEQAERLRQEKLELENRIAKLQGGRRAIASIQEEKCTGCGICVGVCPVGAIRIEQQLAVVDAVRCTACAACLSQCPNEAILIVPHKV